MVISKASFFAAVGCIAGVAFAGTCEANTLRWAFQGDAQTMDPHGLAETMTLGFQGNVYEGLVRRDAAMKIEGALAERWERINPTIWRFHLRRGVTFHNGNSFDAHDVKFSADRANSDGSGMRGAAYAIGNAKVVDDYTIDIETGRPNPILPMQLELIYMMDKEWAVANGAERGGEGWKCRSFEPCKSQCERHRAVCLVERQPGFALFCNVIPTTGDS